MLIFAGDLAAVAAVTVTDIYHKGFHFIFLLYFNYYLLTTQPLKRRPESGSYSRAKAPEILPSTLPSEPWATLFLPLPGNR
jgi:hypothetical protein